MKWWPFKQKSLAEVQNAEFNKFLQSLFNYQIYGNAAFIPADDQTSYIKNGYQSNSDVYSIINKQCRMASQARLALYIIEAGKWKEITDHELVIFTKQMNPSEPISKFQDAFIVYKQSIGNVYWYKPTLSVGVNAGKTLELWTLPANNVEILSGNSWMNPIGGYNLITNVSVKYEPSEIYHSKYFNPLFGEPLDLYGQSPLKAAIRTVSKMNEAETTELKQFQNQSPPYLLYKDTNEIMGGLNDQQKIEIQDLFKSYASKYKAGHPLVLPDKFGKIDVGISPADLNILESSKEGRRILCNIYGLPSELFNDKEASTYNNMEAVRKDAWNNCLKPLLKGISDGLTAILIYPVKEYLSKGFFFAYDYSEIPELQADYATQVMWMKQASYTPNEMREATGAKPINDPLMNEPWFGMGDSPLSSMSGTGDPLPLKGIIDYR
jgi:HK97 family phage portal protein